MLNADSHFYQIDRVYQETGHLITAQELKSCKNKSSQKQVRVLSTIINKYITAYSVMTIFIADCK